VADIASYLGPLAAFATPLFVYLAARHQLGHQRQRDKALDSDSLCARLASAVERYAERIEGLELKLAGIEGEARTLRDDVTTLRGNVRRWRRYALALVDQLRGAGIPPHDPADFGLTDDDG
jgi:hypothetical protein